MIYEYQCNECDSKFDKNRPMSESSDPAECPWCEGSVMAPRVLSTTANMTRNWSMWQGQVGGRAAKGAARARKR